MKLGRKQKEALLEAWSEDLAIVQKGLGPIQTVQEFANYQDACFRTAAHLEEAMRIIKGPAKAPMGGGEQVVCTPRPFFELLELKLDVKFGFDLSATHENALCPEFFGPSPYSVAMDCLTQDWTAVCGPDRWAFQNPEYAYVLPYVRKGRMECERGARFVQLLKASIGSKWFYDNCYGGPCHVLKMFGRLPFIGYDGMGANFDTMIIVWDGLPYREEVWDWRTEMKERMGVEL